MRYRRRTSFVLGLAAFATATALVLVPAAGAAPVWTYVPGPQIYVEATSPAGAAVSFDFPRAEADTPDRTAIPVTCNHFGGEFFPFGLTHVLCQATHNSVTTGASFEVIVRDTAAPGMTAPSDFTLEATGAAGAVATFNATAYDLVDGGRPVTCTKASGTIFPIGATTVTCSATDLHANTATKTFKVTVQDTKSPLVDTAADQTAEATSAGGAVVTFTAPTAADIVDGAIPVTCAPASGATFALGTTTVTCTAKDAHANTTTRTFTVTVRDTKAPTLTVPKSIRAKAANAKGARVSYAASAVDAVDGEISPKCKPASGARFKVGVTIVSCTATDVSGNQAVKSFKVTVRH